MRSGIMAIRAQLKKFAVSIRFEAPLPKYNSGLFPPAGPRIVPAGLKPIVTQAHHFIIQTD
jgi:hypothetical protein